MLAPVEPDRRLVDPQFMEMPAPLDEPREGQGVEQLITNDELRVAAGHRVDGCVKLDPFPRLDPLQRPVDSHETNLPARRSPLAARLPRRQRSDQAAVATSNVHYRGHHVAHAAQKLVH